MCCCRKPVVNGQPGYRWQPDHPPSIRPIDPPKLEDNEVLLFDEPGRCGGLDSHSYHYRVVRTSYSLTLIVRHGGGDVRVPLSTLQTLSAPLAALDSTSRYWLLNAIYHAHSDGERDGRSRETLRWSKAAAEKRIKTRKQRGMSNVRVWIEE